MAITSKTTVNAGDEVRYQIGNDWVRAKVLDVFPSDSLSKAMVATIEFWHQGRKETMDVWCYSLRPASDRPSIIIPVGERKL